MKIIRTPKIFLCITISKNNHGVYINQAFKISLKDKKTDLTQFPKNFQTEEESPLDLSQLLVHLYNTIRLNFFRKTSHMSH